jgi:hypothetical protein
MDDLIERTMLGVAHALFMNRLHLLRLTEVVRLGIRPSPDDGNMELPGKLDAELKQQAIDYILTCFPPEYAPTISAASADWVRLQ